MILICMKPYPCKLSNTRKTEMLVKFSCCDVDYVYNYFEYITLVNHETTPTSG
jgi:hypothetical protein